MFSKKTAARELRRYHKKGPNKSTRLMLEPIRRQESENLEGKTLLDIGGGIGAISFELLKNGIGKSTHIDASTGYLEVSQKEAEERGLSDRITYRFGDFTDIDDDLEPADVVTLDRVVCCYPDREKLIGKSLDKALKYYGLVYPRDRMGTRIAIAIGNLWFKLRRSDFRTYLHPPEEIDRQIQSKGFTRIGFSRTFIWEAAVYRREAT